MTLGELIYKLQEMEEVYGEDVEIRLMTQQNWPFENAITGVTSKSIMFEADEDEDEKGDEGGDEKVGDEEIVYIVEGGQICYGSKAAWECC